MLPRPGCRMGVKENKTKVQARAKLVYSLSRPSSAYQGESRQVDSYGVRSVLPRVLAIRVTCGGAGGIVWPKSPAPFRSSFTTNCQQAARCGLALVYVVSAQQEELILGVSPRGMS